MVKDEGNVPRKVHNDEGEALAKACKSVTLDATTENDQMHGKY
jgi:hypothetical protein